MATLTVVVSILLIMLGLGGYFATGTSSVTALIPAFFGVVLLVLGLWGRNPGSRKMAMHIAVALALLGVIGSVRGLLQLPTLLSGGEVARPAAVVSQSVMAVALLFYVAMGVRSFVAARRARA